MNATDGTGASADTSGKRANNAARVAAVAIALIGCLVVVWPSVDHVGSVMNSNPFAPRQEVTTVVKQTGETTATTTTTADASGSFAERAFAAGGLLLLRLGVVALAAFLAGALVQRIWLGEFALKLGPLEVPDIQRTAAASDQAIAELVDQLNEQKQATVKAMRLAADTALSLADLQGRALRRPTFPGGKKAPDPADGAS